MRKLIILLICLIFVGCKSNDKIAGNGGSAASQQSESSSLNPYAEENIHSPPQLLNCDFHDQRDFDIYTAQAQAYEAGGEIISGVIPHHLLAGQMIASFFKTAAESRGSIETVIIIAPMHYDDTSAVLCTTLSDWATPFGLTHTERDFSERFITELGASVCDYNMQKDHSAAAIMPFVKHYFPEAGTAALLIEANAPSDLPERLAPLLAEFAAKKNCLFVFSVDFSHYLEPAETYRKDEETRAAVMQSDTGRIAFMTNAHMDSPKSIITFLYLSELLGLQLHELAHSNSMEVSGIPYPHPVYDEGLTSYFVFAGVQ
ncbi:MAG: AmmeMemoRadiSam system protein B [Oscillospiraceae bacterium]|nr:AmmeMemoRadiSam system protein B [Oscillospiraceae bacterium]